MSPEDTAVPGATPGAAPTGETPTTPQTQEPTAPQTPEVTSGSETPTSVQPVTTDDLQAQVKRLEASLKRANAEAASSRHAAKELKDLQDKLAAEKLTETERLQKKAADAEARAVEVERQFQEHRTASIIKDTALAIGFTKPQAAMKLLDWAELLYDSDGKPTNVSDLLDAIKTDYPELVRQPESPKPAPAPNPGATNPGRPTTGNNGKMHITADQYNDPQFRADYLARYGKTVFQAGNDGDFDFINTPIRRR